MPRLVSLIIASILPALSWALIVTTLEIGGTVDGTTTGRSASIPFSRHASSPQAVYSFNVKSESSTVGDEVDLRFSTCIPASVASEDYTLQSSVLIVVEASAVSGLGVSDATGAVIEATAVSAPDCGGGHATLDFRARKGVAYFLIVTSSEARSGGFRLTTQITASPPTPTPLPWGLDRIDQRTLPLDGKYSVTGLSGTTTYVYVLDSGVKTSHSEFLSNGGKRNAVHGTDVVERLDYATDCTGHGTHVAATIAGKTFGVAKDAMIISVRVVGCDGGGHTSRLIEGLEWVLSDSAKSNRRPALVAMSLSAPKSELINDAVRKLSEEGIPVVTAAGNTDENSCNFSPASESSSITVAASQRDDSRPMFSNSGACVDLFAPGHEILSAWNTGDHSHRIQSGTSFACPHVAGAVAVLLSVNPELPTSAVANMIYSAATFAMVSNHTSSAVNSQSEDDNLSDFNNRLLYVRPIPSLSVKAPEEGQVYLYAVLTLSMETSECSSQWLSLDQRGTAVSKEVSELASMESQGTVETWMCCQNGADESQCGAPSSDSRLFIRLQEIEALASARFETLQSGLRDPQLLARLKTSLKVSSVSVSVEPWVVDSDSNVFWAAPDLRASSRSWRSVGAIAAISACAIAMLIGAITCVCVLRRRRRENLERSEYENAVAKHNKQRELNDPLQAVGNFDGSTSPRGYIARENTALAGDVLLNLPSSATLQTPRNAEEASLPTPSRNAGPFTFGPVSPRTGGTDSLFSERPRAKREIGGGDGGGARRGGLATNGVSFFGRLSSFNWRNMVPSPSSSRHAGQQRAQSPLSTRQTPQERAEARQRLEASRPFRPFDAVQPSRLEFSKDDDEQEESHG